MIVTAGFCMAGRTSDAAGMESDDGIEGKEQAGAGQWNQRLPHHLYRSHPPPGVQLLAGHEVVLGRESGGLTLLPAKGPNDPHAGERLGRAGVYLLALLADDAELRADVVDPRSVREVHRRQENERPDQQRGYQSCTQGSPDKSQRARHRVLLEV
jgi:hypothetical protein